MKISRFVKIIFLVSFLGIFAGCQNSTKNTDLNKNQNEEDKIKDMDTNKKTLVVYFSQTGTTERLAKYAADILNADIYEIIAAKRTLKKISHITQTAVLIRNKTILQFVLKYLVK